MDAAAAIKMLSPPSHQIHRTHSLISSPCSSCFSSEIRFHSSLLSFTNLDIRSISICRRTIDINSSGAISSVAMARMESSFKPEEARIPAAIPLSIPPITKFKIALCQLSVTADKELNIAHARQVIEEAAGKGAQLILLPEIWNSPYSNDSFPITIVGGSIPDRSGDRLYNACCVFGTDGKLKAKHRKIHLFDIDIPGQMTFKESKTLTAGETPTIVDTDVGRIGIGICYDIRFQELAAIYAARGAHLLCYPGAFNMTTGPLHWELLQRARAADCQLYVATCSPARDTGSTYVAWGHSTLVGPFGEVLATTEHDEAIVISEIDYSIIEQRRTYLPFQRQRRGDLYQLVDIQRLNSTRTT
ncbi:omega-amidase, chloroplastic-like isoform X2 [Primulina huaijiensis]|uniref:omega-amidase, chloroplastic-like isoform X2 n=1 Tax=Primulina huaijiensis TaxID=1492673 RepID=UPI003CC6F4D7